MIQKHFVDISVLVEKDVVIDGNIVKKCNCGSFEVGDIISITEKVDGSNASIRYDIENETLVAFSRKQELNFENTLDGFWNYVKSLTPKEFSDTPNYVIFGEWLRKNKITYRPDAMHKWYVYSIYDVENECWLERDAVIDFANSHNLTYVHEFYYGPFISWEHCRSFCHSPLYGDTQEGVVVRNISKTNVEIRNHPHILKIVNAEFAEAMRHKVVDPEKAAAREKAQELMQTIVTKNRVEKGLLKLRDEGILPEYLSMNDMGLVAKNLPRYIYNDCLKEERETMELVGENAGKICGSLTMNLARSIILEQM